jgi:cytochrome c oxidase assembly protein subunit 15
VPQNPNNVRLHRFSVFTAVATLLLIGVGGLVTSKGAGMAVPDWPTSYGYNMFALPIHLWTGGALYEHTHRLWASVVGLLVVALMRWLGGHGSRKPLALVGMAELLAGFAILLIWPNLKGTGFFLAGIGGVVLLAALVWVKNESISRPLVTLGWIVFFLVQIQGLLGGLRVVLLKDHLGIFHAALAQVFFVLLCIIALLTSRTWKKLELSEAVPSKMIGFAAVTATLLIFAQLMIGASMRHQHAGLAVPDFPLAYGKLWPATDPDSILRYNQQRVEIFAVKPITAFQVQLHMIHRLMAIVILVAVAGCAWAAVRRAGWNNPFVKLAILWLALILVQAGLGIATVLFDKAADIATAHVLVGVLSLATGAALCIFTRRSHELSTRARFLSGDAAWKFDATSVAHGSRQQ